MDGSLSTPPAETIALPTSTLQPAADIDVLASQAVDSLYSKNAHAHTASMSSLSASPFMQSSVDEQAQMSQQYSELMAQNELLAKENRLFDSFLQRNAAAAIEHEKSPKHGRREKNRQQLELTLSDVRPTATTHLCVTLSQRPCPSAHRSTCCVCSGASQLDRNRLAVDELAYRSRQLTSLQQKSTSDLALLRSISLNMQLRQQEVKKQAFEFQREVVMHTKQHHTSNTAAARQHSDSVSDTNTCSTDVDGSVGAGGGGGGGGSAVTSEVLLRFLSDAIRDKQSTIKKLTMKIRHQKSSLHMMHQQLKQKEEQGDSLHSIDFHQLQIKNSQYNSKIKDKNEQLLQLKSGAGLAVNRLNSIKKIMSDELNDNRAIKRSMKVKHDMIDRMSSEMDKVELEIRMETMKQNKLKQVQSNPDMPHVMDYVRQKMEYEQLVEMDRNWDRKTEIAQTTHVQTNSARIQQQRRQYQQQQQQQQASTRREQEEKEQWRGLNVAVGGALFPTTPQ